MFQNELLEGDLKPIDPIRCYKRYMAAIAPPGRANLPPISPADAIKDPTGKY